MENQISQDEDIKVRQSRYGVRMVIDEVPYHHADMVDAYAYMIAGKQMEIVSKYIDEYYVMFVNPKPKYIPKWAYDWILSKVLKLDQFKHTKKSL